MDANRHTGWGHPCVCRGRGTEAGCVSAAETLLLNIKGGPVGKTLCPMLLPQQNTGATGKPAQGALAPA